MLSGESLFPMALRLRRPSHEDWSHRFDEVRAWSRALDEDSRPRRGFGYDIEFEEVEHRQVGRNRVPARITVPSVDDALRLLRKTGEAKRFMSCATRVLGWFPALRSWFLAKPLKALELEDRWDRLLAVLTWLEAHPHSGLYQRELAIEGVDTKFIEDERGVLTELLDVLAPAGPDATGRRPTFEQRVGLRSKPSLIRVRILDDALRVGGFSEMTVPAPELARADLAVDVVFVTENEINFLTLPPRPKSLVVFGQGYAIDRVSSVPWLARRRVYYWGDIDTHGFAALDRLRQYVPTATSILMDRETLLQHRAMWVEEPDQAPGPLTRLDAAEQQLFFELRGDVHGRRVRLEQERISFPWVTAVLARLP